MSDRKGYRPLLVKMKNNVFYDIGDQAALLKNPDNAPTLNFGSTNDPMGLYLYGGWENLIGSDNHHFTGTVVSNNFNMTNLFVDPEIYFTMLPR